MPTPATSVVSNSRISRTVSATCGRGPEKVALGPVFQHHRVSFRWAAFDTETGMPFGTVNLRMGVPDGETSITCTAGVGTFIVEFGTLSRLTGDPVFEKVAMRAMEALWQHRSAVGLVTMKMFCVFCLTASAFLRMKH